jgi:predicted nucleotidyltransferase
VDLMYTVEGRTALIDRIVEIARSDRRVVAGAVIGSLAFGSGDRWSDVDLTFAIDRKASRLDVLDDWADRLRAQLDAVVLFDLPSGETLYRVFFLASGLQVDVSVTPENSFGPGGPKFRLLFGEANAPPQSSGSPARELFGWGVAYVREARACVERGRFRQAEHSIDAIRENALALACLRRGLPARFGRGLDDLPAEVLERFDAARPRSLRREDLLAGLSLAAEGLLSESEEAGDVAVTAAPGVRALVAVDA